MTQSNKSFIIFFTLFFFAFNGREWSQPNTQSIRDQVLDVVTEIPLVGAEVYLIIDQEWRGTTTDQNGRFSIRNVAVGRQTIYCRYLG